MNIERIGRVLVAATLSLGLMGGVASAATFLFDDTGGRSGTTTLNYTSGGLELDVISTGGDINRGANGLGVHGPPASGRMSGPESLTFVFTETVHLLSSIIFGRGGGIDEITITDGTGAFLTSFIVGDGTNSNSLETVGLNLSGDTFVFTRTDGTGPFHGVRIQGLTATAVVPVPAALPLMIGGFGLLGFVARRRKNAASA